MEHHILLELGLCLGTFLVGLVFFEGINFPYYMGCFFPYRIFLVCQVMSCKVLKLCLQKFFFPLKAKKIKEKNEKQKKRKEKNEIQKKENQKKERRKKRIKGSFNSFLLICGSISIGVRVLVLLMFLWFSVGCSIVFMAFSSALPKHLSPSFPYLSTHITTHESPLDCLMHIAFYWQRI